MGTPNLQYSLLQWEKGVLRTKFCQGLALCSKCRGETSLLHWVALGPVLWNVTCTLNSLESIKASHIKDLALSECNSIACKGPHPLPGERVLGVATEETELSHRLLKEQNSAIEPPLSEIDQNRKLGRGGGDMLH